MAELWSGFLQLNHFPRDNTIDLSVKGNPLVHSQDMRLGYSDSHTITSHLLTALQLLLYQNNNN